MRTPDHDNVRELAGFRPPHGVLSVFVDLDPANRGDAWRIRLRDSMDEAIADRRGDPDVKATVERVNLHFRDHGNHRETGRYVVGFLEVAAKGGRDEWFELQAPHVETHACLADGPCLPPLVKLLDQAPVAGVVALSSEHVRLYEWRFGLVEHVADFDFDRGDLGRERKSPRVDPSQGTATTSSGRDQFNQRLEENHNRFLNDAGERIVKTAEDRGWRKMICFGPEPVYRAFAGHMNEPLPRLAGKQDLIEHPLAEVARAASVSIADWEAERERAIVERATAAALAVDGRGAVGMKKVGECLNDGRVEHLVYDSSREFNGELDKMLERAITTGAHVTPVEGDRAAALADHEGMAAILRY